MDDLRQRYETYSIPRLWLAWVWSILLGTDRWQTINGVLERKTTQRRHP